MEVWSQNVMSNMNLNKICKKNYANFPTSTKNVK